MQHDGITSWRGACANLSRRAFERSLAASEGTKQRFFAAVASASAPLRLTHARHATSDRTIASRLRFAFVGDSLARDLFMAWHDIAPQALSWLVAEDRVVLPGAPHVEAALSCLRNGTIDALFVGFGLHYALRAGSRWGARPWDEQQAWRQLSVARLGRLASASGGRPVVLIGSLPVEAEVMMLHPAKKDYDAFHDVGWMHVQASPHASLNKSHTRRVALIRCQTLLQVALERAMLRAHPQLLRLPLEALAAKCPGTRCDGVHWSADFDAFACRSAFGLLASFLLEWLGESGLLNAAAAAARGADGAAPSCASVPWEHQCPRSPPRRYLHGKTKSMCRCLDQSSGPQANHLSWAF